MVDEIEKPAQSIRIKKRKNMPNKRHNSKRMKVVPGMGKKVKVSQKMQKLYRKRARDYNSDNEEDEDEDDHASESDGDDKEIERRGIPGNSDDEAGFEEGEDSQDERKIQTGITRFAEGCKAFRVAFLNIMKKHVDDDSLGPVLSAHKKLVLAKLSEEVADRKVKGEAKKEKHLIEEKGHVKPAANFLDSHEKFLIGVATKGVVKLFNAVNKAQVAQKGLNPSWFKDAKEVKRIRSSLDQALNVCGIIYGTALTKRRKEAFMTELSRTSAQSTEAASKESNTKGEEDGSQPAWAPLRDTFMLTNSKLKDWDKMAEEETDI